MQINAMKTIAAGLAGALAMTAVGVYVAPMMGMPKMNPADLLSMQMGGNAMLGWAGHLMIGIVLAFGYTMVARFLPGPAAVRGATYALAPWLVSQVVMMPMMGMGLFSGSMMLAGGSLIGHLVYGTIVGGVIGTGGTR